jgi:hypothetical protein
MKIYKNYKHGDHLTKLHALWRNMRYRCRCKTSKDYARYGGRGVRVCRQWEDYGAFKKWANKNGYRDGLKIDRKDNNGDYCPENCHFVDIKESNRNKSNGRYWFVYGKRFRSSLEAAKFWGVCQATICYWCGLRRGKPMPHCYTVKQYENY